MAISVAPLVPEVGLTLSLGARVVDLATRALVVAVVPPPRWARESEVVAGVRAAAETGADLVEVPAEPRLVGPAAAASDIPIAARVTTPKGAAAATIAGAAVLLVPDGHIGDVASDDQADEWQTVDLVGDPHAAQQAVLTTPDRVVGLDVTTLSGADAVSQESLGLSVGARLIRTNDVRRTRRVVEVMAALLHARSGTTEGHTRDAENGEHGVGVGR